MDETTYKRIHSRGRLACFFAPVWTTIATAGVVAAPPANDNCNGAIQVSAGIVYSFTNVGATNSSPALEDCDGSSNPMGKDVWFKFVSPWTGKVTVSLCGSSFDTIAAVYSGCGCPASTNLLVGCDDDACDENESAVSFNAAAGVCYTIRVGGFQDDRFEAEEGEVALFIDAATPPPPPPLNDECVNAPAVGIGVTTFSILNATTSDPVLDDCEEGVAMSDDVWFSFLSPCSGDVTVSLCGSSFYTYLAVYAGCGCPTAPNSALACNYVAKSCPMASELTFSATAGACYLIRVGDDLGGGDAGTMTISCVPITIDEVWVNFGYLGTELGTEQQPFNTLAEAIAVVEVGGTIKVISGSSPLPVTISKAVTINAINGPVTLGQ